jgi:TRAP transporter TAXI family solute receptor
MNKVFILMGAFLLGALPAASASAQTPQRLSNYEQMKQDLNQITVSIVVSGMQCTCARFAEDIRNVVNDLTPNGVRVLPILGVGGIQNLQDVLFLKGVDMGTVDQDHLEYLKTQDPSLYGNIDDRINFIAKLYNSEFHVAARKDFQKLSDLQGKRVSFNLENSHTHIAADIIFNMAGVTTTKTFHDNDEALQLLKAGKIDAHIVLTGAPQSGLAKLKATDNIHLLAITEGDLPAATRDKLFNRYLPADLTADHYPELVAKGSTVPTIATRTALAVYNWEENTVRYRKMERFVHEFFSKIDRFKDKSRHAKWAEVNLSADIPGWKRFKPAQQWLDGARAKPVASLPAEEGEEELRKAFEGFLARYSSSQGGAISDQERAKLFAQFKQFLAYRNSQARNQ